MNNALKPAGENPGPAWGAPAGTAMPASRTTMQSQSPVRILHLEDEPSFCELVRDMLAEEGLAAELSVVADLPQLKAALDNGSFDVILADYNLPTCTGIEALQLAAARSRRIPFILISGAIDEHSAIEALRSGATDYVLKAQLERLAPVVRRALTAAREHAELVQAQTKLEARDRFLSALTENSLDAVAVVSSDGLFQYASPSVKHVLSYEAQELVGRQAFSFVHPEDVAGARQALQNALAHPELRVRHELRFRRRDDTWCDLEIDGQSHLDNPDVRGVVLNSRDITARKQAEGKMRLQSVALESAYNAIVITDRAGTVIWANPAFTRISGYTNEEVVGNTLRLVKSGEHSKEFYGRLWQTILSGKVWRSEVVNRRKDGRLFTEEATITPVLSADGEVTHFIAVKQDVSERKEAERELQQTHLQLLEASRQAAVAEFATSILHNVGNVLNSIGVASGCLAQNLRRSHAARLSQVATLIAEHQNRLGDFFTNDAKGKLVPAYLAQLAKKLTGENAAALEEIARLQRGVEHVKAIITVQQAGAKGCCSSETTNLTDLIQDVVELHANALARARIKVSSDIAENREVVVQKHQILQILVNLVRNAVESCQAAKATNGRINIRAGFSEGRLVLAVSDNGLGISNENLQRIFELGFTTKKGGHGFGLNSCRAAAREMGGSLSVQSEGEGRGATFTLELPVQLHLPSPGEALPSTAGVR